MYDRQVGLNLISGNDERANEETHVASNPNKSNPYLHLGKYVSANENYLLPGFKISSYSISGFDPETFPLPYTSSPDPLIKHPS